MVCQTEMVINGKIYDQDAINKASRQSKAGYISSQTLGAWGYTFLDYGNEHVITDQDGEQTKQFIITHIQKGTDTVVTLHEDKKHIY